MANKISKNKIDNNTMVSNEMSNITRVKFSAREVICIICAILLCVVPFIPFVDQQDIIYDFNDLSSRTVTVSHLVLYLRWYGYLPVFLAIFVAISTFIKNRILSYIMLTFDVCIVGGFVYWANKVVARIFEGELYEPSAGYYILLLSGIIILIAKLMEIMKTENSAEALKDGNDNAGRDRK